MADRSEFYARHTIEICSADFTPQGFLRDWDSLTMVDRYGDIGSGAVNCSGSDHNRELVQAGCTVVVKRDGVVEHAGPLEFGEDQGDTVVQKVNWKDQNTYLNERLAWPDPTTDMSPTGATLAKATDDRRGFTSSVIMGFVAANCGPAALSFRRVPGLVMGVDHGFGVYLNAPVQARFDNVLTLARQLAMTGGVGFGIDLFDRTGTFNCWEVSDLSADVVFSAQTHNLVQSSFFMNGPGATALVTGGKGQDAARLFALITSMDSLTDADAWRYIEAFRDDNSSEGDSFVAAALRDLAAKGSTVTASFTPTNNALKYGRDYRLGDLVKGVVRPGLAVVKPIREVTRKNSVSGGYQVVPVAGDYGATSSTGTQFQTKELIRVVDALKRTR